MNIVNNTRPKDADRSRGTLSRSVAIYLKDICFTCSFVVTLSYLKHFLLP